jgi:hypothetical protein
MIEHHPMGVIFMSNYVGEWALKLVKKAVKNYVMVRTPRGIIKRKIRRIVKSYNVRLKEIEDRISMLLIDSLVNLSKKMKEENPRSLLEFIKKLEDKGEKND